MIQCALPKNVVSIMAIVTVPQHADLSKKAMEYVMLTATTKSAATIQEIATVLQDVTSLPLAMVSVTHSA